MSLLRASASGSTLVTRRNANATIAPLRLRRQVAINATSQKEQQSSFLASSEGPVKALVAASFGILSAAPSAQAATEMMQLAAGDNRPAILATLFLPVLGWVAFNMAGPILNQLNVMGDKAEDTPPEARSIRTKKRSVAGAVGLGAASLLATSQSAEASELMQLAAGDNRPAILATLFLPVLGWVAFNMLGPVLNQLSVMGEKAEDTPPEARSIRTKKRSVAGAVGLGAASLLASTQAAEASELMQLAAGDNRPAILATLFLPVLGWVAFNMAGPILNQLNVMGDKAEDTPPEARSIRTKKRSVAGAVGLGAASLLASTQAAEASELMQLAASDNRPFILATLFLPVLGWVAFNMLGPVLNQLSVMGEKAEDTPPEARSGSIKKKKK